MGTHQDQARKFSFNPGWRIDSQGFRVSSEGGWLRTLARVAALFFAILLLCISHPQRHLAASGGGSDEDVWQGTVTVVTENHMEIDKTESFQPPGVVGCSHSDRHVSRTHDQKTTTYSDFRLLRMGESGASGTWDGTARVNVSYSGATYTLDVHKDAQCYEVPPSSREEGFETTDSGSGVGQGQVTFSRSTDEGSGKTTCHIDADSQNEIGKIQEVGRKWDSKREEPVKQEQSLLAGIAHVSFDCAPYAKSYSGQQRVQNPDGTSTDIVTWNIHGPLPETEVELIPPKAFDNWLPEAGRDEKHIGNMIEIEVVAHKKGDPGADPPKKVLKYTIELEDTSREKGVDLNWPQGGTDDLDMKLDKDNPAIEVTDGDDCQKAKTKKDGLTKFTVTVNSYDWGGYSKLHVTAELEDHSIVVGHVRGHSDQDFLVIPKDDNSNHIADYWEHWFDIKNPDASADDDDTPYSNAGKGDSIALYNEYRGFHIQRFHERLSPEIKDLFVWDQNQLGVGFYGDTGINVHVIKEDEKFDEGYQKSVTPNGRHGKVCVLWLKAGSLGNGVIGETVGAVDVPCNIESITIDLHQAPSHAYVESSIAHELSHATGVRHHGPNEGLDYNIGDALCRVEDKKKGGWKVINYPCSVTPKDKNGNSIGIGQPAFDCWEVAVKGGKFSGNDQCWMRYDETNFYEDPGGNCEWQHNGKTVHGNKYYPPPRSAWNDNLREPERNRRQRPEQAVQQSGERDLRGLQRPAPFEVV